MTAREKLLAAVVKVEGSLESPSYLLSKSRKRGALLALEAAAEACEAWFLDHGGKTHEPIACADAIRALAKEIADA